MVLLVLTLWCSQVSLVPLLRRQPFWVVRVLTPSARPVVLATYLWLVVLVLTASTPQALATTDNSTMLGGDGNDTIDFAGGATTPPASRVKLVTTPSPLMANWYLHRYWWCWC